ncbi:serrate RNA effector molecule homolog isoform X1 [Ceratitis capitata]|uniref:serrate RNA effector molecule homolog isoform X1 n=1 Tax=Ceratitis capitata TaxID=7213 RepID=UPI00032A021E|nr:serrate RNA effector molecule homolog isoform X1 [Ceratitis capitata]XP_004534684.1 serrate RNA effector molecule homolog isoform X1 [Ceratitis capitata]XP_020716755.1 serrate RNA effector molecule homolog isoform X1 [Ceratitis capitata]
MADSDDEYDRKRRDKFRGERSSGDSYRSERRDDRRGGGGTGGGGRDDWAERNPFRGGGGSGSGSRPRPDYRDYRSGGRERYGSPGREMPPAKRMRPDWGEDMRGAPRYGYDPYLMHAWNEHYAAHGYHGGYGGHNHAPHASREAQSSGDLQTQPAMLTLKQFLDTQDDGISDSEVLRKYSEYKIEFKRQQLNEFFVAHKDEEWFKNKYHPADSVKRKEEQLNFLKKRVDVFNELLVNGQVKAVSIDTSQTDPLLRLLDTVVIKLEGGTDDDLKILDEKPREYTFPERSFDKKPQHDDDVIITSVGKKRNEDDEPKVVSPRPIRRAPLSDDEENWDDDDAGDNKVTTDKGDVKKDHSDEEDKSDEEEKGRDKKSLKRKRTSSESSSSSSSDSDSSSSSSSDEEDDEKVKDKYDLGRVKEEKDAEKNVADDVKEKEDVDKTIDAPQDKEVASVENNLNGESEKESQLSQNGMILNEKAENSSEQKDGEAEAEGEKDDSEKIAEPVPRDDDMKEATFNNNNPKSEDAKEDKPDSNERDEKEVDLEKKEINEPEDQPETIDLDKVKDGPQPRALHRTSSIFLRNLAPSITKAEIETLCQRFDGYLRVAIADPLVDRRWYRRGWVTFKRDVNIKEICWNLNNTRLRDCEMGAIVNRDLSRRVRPVNGMTAHKTIVRSDIKLCAKIAMNLDERFKLWDKNNQKNTEQTAENSKGNGDAAASYGFKSNNPVLQNITDYLIEEASAEEDELLGISGENKESEGEMIERDVQLISVLDSLILYLRIVHSVDFYNHCEYPYEDEMPNRCGIIHARGPPPSKVQANDIQDYIKNFESKMQTFLTKTTPIDDEELKNLGSKDAEAEVEKFVQANTQELAKDKWLCPLSGKKFKGPEFIRKHIFNKHTEKVDEVRKEVEFFNNYLRDPKRPQLPEHASSSKRTTSESGGLGYRPSVYPPAFMPPYAAYAPPMMVPGRGGRGFGPGRREPMEQQRRIIGYHDLDAPANFDMFE